MQKIAIIGASYLQKPLVMKARELGYETHVFAWEEGAVCKAHADLFYPVSIIEIEEILSICLKIQPTGVATIGSDLATIAVNHVANGLGLVGNSTECTKITTNKFLMRDRLDSKGLPCPGYRLYRAGEDILDLDPQVFPLVVKPVDRSGSRGVTLVDNHEEMKAAADSAARESFSGGAIIEQYVTGRELSVEAISWEGKHHVLQFTDKETTGAPHFIEKAHHQPAYLDGATKAEIANIVSASLDALEVKYGASHSEIKIDETGKIYIIEIGARMGGDCIGSHLVQLSTGYDFVRGVIDVAVGRFEEPAAVTHSCSGIHYVFPQPGYLNAVVFKGGQGIVDHDVLIQLGSQIPPITNSSQRPAYYIYRAGTRMPFDPDQLRLITAESA